MIAAFLSAVAAISAAIATWRGPIAAAKMANELRSKSEQSAEARRFKFHVFASLMQERAEIYSPDSVKALNSIDVVFSDSTSVREAWSELYQALNSENGVPSHVIDERLRKLLREMSIDLGISDALRLDDFGRVYLPNALADEAKVRDLQRRLSLAQLTAQHRSAGESESAVEARWPPKPEPKAEEDKA